MTRTHVKVGTRSLLFGAHQFAIHPWFVAAAWWRLYGSRVAWSYDARRGEPLPGHAHRNCANCLPYALRWRARILNRLQAVQLSLPVAAEGAGA